MVTFQDSLVSIDVHQVIYIWVQFTTRLISIVTKPIKVAVVVVVIVVVFVKKNLVQKIFDPKTIHVQKPLGLKVLDPKEICVKKKFVHKKFWSKK